MKHFSEDFLGHLFQVKGEWMKKEQQTFEECGEVLLQSLRMGKQ